MQNGSSGDPRRSGNCQPGIRIYIEMGDSAAHFKFPPTPELVACVTDNSRPIAQRMRAVFYLRTIGGDVAVDALCRALKNKSGTCLFRHETAYVLGQMEARGAVPDLVSVLKDSSDDPIVRHEAGEALGAIADPESLAVLDEHSTDVRPEVAETCQIAAQRVRWAIARAAGATDDCNLRDNPFHSIDPAPSARKPAREDVPVFRSQLLDASLPLFERYKAMFSLRNNGSKAAVLVRWGPQ